MVCYGISGVVNLHVLLYPLTPKDICEEIHCIKYAIFLFMKLISQCGAAVANLSQEWRFPDTTGHKQVWMLAIQDAIAEWGM